MIRFAVPLVSLLLAGCTPLGTFNALVPKDGGVARVARDAVFREGPRGRLDLYRPVQANAAGRLPVIVFIHGGSWQSGDKDGYGFVGRALAAQGFLVAVPGYRLVPEVHFPAFVEDGAEAVRWVRANAARFGGDPDRIVLVGYSAGAYNAAMLSLDPQWLGADRAAVKGLVGIAGPYDFLPLDTEVSRAAFGRAPDLAATQPVNFASRDDPPALLLTGARDEVVYPRNSLRLAERLNEAGAKADAKVYADIGHVGILTALSRLLRGKAPVLRDTAGFAHRVTRVPAEAAR